MMSIRRSTLQLALLQIVPLVLLAALALILAWVCVGGQAVSLQSPVSPVPPESAPVQAPGGWPGTSPLMPGEPPISAPIKLPRLFSATQWSSPWPWVAVGIVLFGGLAWALIVLFRRFEPGKSSASDSPKASEMGALPVSTEHKAHPQEGKDEGEIQIDIR